MRLLRAKEFSPHLPAARRLYQLPATNYQSPINQ
jgi:hypothetical protein